MAAEERNFRNQYYDKMGFRVVEEKKSLETMLSSDTIDVKKMRTFCLRFCLPIVTRPLVWKVLLTVLPPHRQNHEFVYRMRCQQFDLLKDCLNLLRGLPTTATTAGGEKEEEEEEEKEDDKVERTTEEGTVCADDNSGTIGGSAEGAAPASGAACCETGVSKSGVSNKPNDSSNSHVTPAAAIGDDDDNKSLTFLRMYLLEEGQLGFNEGDSLSRRRGRVDEGDPLLRRRENRLFVRIADTMTQIYDDDRDAFFAAVCFFKTLAIKYEDLYHLLPDCMLKLLRQIEGDDDRLLKHLLQVQLFRHLPYAHWFKACFAGVIPAIALDKIWDKVIAGSCMILVHVGAWLLLTKKRLLLTLKTWEEMTAALAEIPSDVAEVVVSKALDSWSKAPALVPVPAKEDSPVIIDRIPS